ncbi:MULTISPECIES: AfsR/SARP family transcriptional regulator [Streptomyces]|uniref:AfsR/SARP family transcriptional regulator n=1 Tax=Streptomyces TaxID=1883 RepID=UPI001E3AB56E|nr:MULTISPECIES: BTAD domain-containing putative transcriptional regulator [Streptomyces]UFQ18773.1 tetratricopeptide repeat protein [Streptomyces huasconensis]WCL88390.1 BTAD domain-containing putative transcriptional regulator [Streptomyces sp. JCM 35825]
MEIGIRVLGTVALEYDGRIDLLGSAKERLVLATLGIHAGRPVSLDTLIHRLWDDHPPAKPRAGLHTYAARIRRRLRENTGDDLLVQRAHTYLLDVRPEQVDCHRFEQLAARARALADGADDTAALALLREAAELWRGEPLAGLGGPWAESVRASLSQKRLAAQLTRIEAELRRGHYAELVPDIAALLERHPGDETLAAHLMTATYGCGRQAEALHVYETVRRHLREHLGTDPGEALTRLHRLVLNGAPAQKLLPRRGPAATAPHTLPRHPELVGREKELAAITRAAERGNGAVIALQAISGMAGVGKTLLALHAARRLEPLFPDGQLHLDLRAHSPGRAPLCATSALGALLRMLGVPATDLPDRLDELVYLWRTLLCHRRAVIVLDDAADPEHVRPLLPGPSPSLMIVTSRRRLSGLPGVRPVLLDVLPEEDAVTLFRELAGEGRTPRVREVTAIVRLCGRLPLATEIAARRLASRPSWTTGHLLHRLTHGHGRLREIRDGNQEMARAFEVSYSTLRPEERSVFRLLGLQLGPDYDTFSTAALTDLSFDDAERILEGLLDAHLIQEPTPDRYTTHDLLGEYSRMLAASELGAPERESALRRLIDFYVQASDAADRLIAPRRPRPHLPRRVSAHRTPAWSGAAEARRWLAAECSALIAAERHCRTHGHPHEASLLAGSLAGFLLEEKYAADSQGMHRAAAEHWRSLAHPEAEAYALVDQGAALSRSGRYDQALTVLGRALDTARDIDGMTVAEVLHARGVLLWNLGRLPEALADQEETLTLRMRSGAIWQVARSHNNLGITHLYLGNLPAARDHFHKALDTFRTVGDAHEEAHVLNNLSDLQLRAGKRESARKYLQEARKVLAVSGTTAEHAMAQVNLANTMNSPQELHAMLEMYQDSLDSFQRLGDRRNASITLHGMGLALHAAGRFEEAAEHHTHALELARTIGAATEEAQALQGLGAAEHRLGHTTSAADHLTEAAAVAERTGATAEAARARAALAEVKETRAESIIPD